MESGNEIRARHRKDNRLVEQKLLNYQHIKERYEALAYDIAYSTRHDPTGVRAGVGDPTSSKAIRLMDRAGDRLEWICAIEAALSAASEEQRLLFELRQDLVPESRGGRPGWAEEARGQLGRQLKRPLAAVTVKRWWYGLVDICVRVALRKGLI